MPAETPLDAVKQDILRLSDASAKFMESLSKLAWEAGIPGDDPLKKLSNDLRTSQEKIDDEIARVSGIFIRFTGLSIFG